MNTKKLIALLLAALCLCAMLAACGSKNEPASPSSGVDVTKIATIGEAEEELSGLQFSRCSLSYLVNLKRVDRISKDTVIIGGHELPISRNRKKERSGMESLMFWIIKHDF